MSLPVAIDTIVLIRGIREQPDSNDSSAVKRAVGLIANLAEKRSKIVLPAPALNEFMAGTKKGDVDATIKAISESFVVEPFDAYAAVVAGKIWREHTDLMDHTVYGIGKQCLKVDLMIFATAIAKKIGTIYAEDKWFQTIGKKYQDKIKVMAIPPLPDQKRDLFDNPRKQS